MGKRVPLYATAYAGVPAREAVRRKTYGDDLGQSDWLTADELERFAEWIRLDAGSRLLDVGCGSGGPALRLAATTGASVVGLTYSRRE
jgi:2-polyprenyl-3-methyl-5-hydroxy-6-metoxy-1,4-benzoquinol methylase